jgi:DNA/RNA-binding domain of Phe-tRNA-synthetase-like protein
MNQSSVRSSLIRTAAGELAAIVRPIAVTAGGLTVAASDARLSQALTAGAARARTALTSADTTLAVRAMYKRIGIDPTKTRPSSEALLRRVRKGQELPRVNNVVDVINWCSLESQLPFGLYDQDRIHGDVVLRLGDAGEQYAGIRKDVVHVERRLVLADAEGPFGNPTSDSARTMVTTVTTRALVVVFAPSSVAEVVVESVLRQTGERIEDYCRAT